MGRNWLEVVLSPNEVAPHPNEPLREIDERQAVALLLEHRLRDFWETYGGQMATDEADEARGRVLTAIIDYLEGRAADAVATLEVVVDDVSAVDLRAAAAVLASIFMVQSDRRDAAAALLARTRDVLNAGRPNSALVPAAQSLLDLHRGWRAAEAGDLRTALELTDSASQQAAGAPDPAAKIVVSVSRYNAWNFRQRMADPDLPSPVQLLAASVPRALHRRSEQMAAGLTAFVEDDLWTRFASPFATGDRWSSENRALSSLAASVLHAECLADYAGVRRTRTHLGRVTLLRLAEAASIERVIHYGFDMQLNGFRLLVEGGDHQGLDRAASWFLRHGPLDDLADEVDRRTRSAWSPLDEFPTLVLLQRAGDLVRPGMADEAVERLLDLLDGDTSRDSFAPWHHALRALPRLLAAASTEAHAMVARRLVVVAESTEDAALLRALADPLQSVAWDSLTGEVDRWRRFAGSADDEARQWLVARLLLELRHLQPQWAGELAYERFTKVRSLLWASVLVDLDTPLDEPARQAVMALARSKWRRRPRSQATDTESTAALILAALALAGGSAEDWVALLDDLATPGDASTKAAVADYLVRRRRDLDETRMDSLRPVARRWVRHLSDEEQPDESVGSWLRLAIVSSAIDVEGARELFLRLGTSDSPRRRLEATWTLPLLPPALAREVEGWCRWLMRDRTPEVRAAAGASAVELLASPAGGTRALSDGVGELLVDPGVVVPYSVLHASRAVAPVVSARHVAVTERLAGDHPSALVREEASLVLARSR